MLSLVLLCLGCLDWALAAAVVVCFFSLSNLSNKLLHWPPKSSRSVTSYYTIVLLMMLPNIACAQPDTVINVASLPVGRVISGALAALALKPSAAEAASSPGKAKKKKRKAQATASTLVSSANSYQSALSFHPSSLWAIIVIILIRVSPDHWLIIVQNGNDGSCQIVQSIMFVHLLEEWYPDLTFDIFPAVCASKDGSRHDMSTCPGLNYLYRALLHLRNNHPSNPVLIVATESLRFTDKPEDFTAIGTACVNIHPRCEILTVGEAFLPLFGGDGMHQLRFGRDEALLALSANVASRRDVTKSLEDTRTEEEIELQNDILSKALELRNVLPEQLKLDITQAASIGQCKLLTEYADELSLIMGEHYHTLTEVGGSEDYTTVGSNIIKDMKEKFPNSPLTEDLSNVRSAFLSRRSTNSDAIGFGEDMEAATDFPVYQTITNAAALTVLSQHNQSSDSTASLAMFHNQFVNRNQKFTRAPSMMTVLSIYSTNLETSFVCTLDRMGGESPAVKLYIELMNQTNADVIVSSNYAFSLTDLADKEGDRRLEIELIHSQYENARLEKVMELPRDNQIRHFQFSQIRSSKVNHYLKKDMVIRYKRRSNDGSVIEGRIENSLS